MLAMRDLATALRAGRMTSDASREAVDDFRQVMRLIDAGNVVGAIEIANTMVSRGDGTREFVGLFARGLANETGGAGVEPDYGRALADVRRLASDTPTAFTFNNLARARMKQGPSGFPDALRFLHASADAGGCPETELGFATYFRDKPQPDYARSMQHFARAAKSG